MHDQVLAKMVLISVEALLIQERSPSSAFSNR